jgi:hypothetical protein
MSTTDSLLQMPLGIQEMALALWLIVKGFNPTAVESGSARIAVSEGEIASV